MKNIIISGAILYLCMLVFSHQSFAHEWWSRVGNVLNSDSGNKVVAPLSGRTAGHGTSLSNSEIGAGLREALRIGTENVVERLGRHDGFNLDPNVHIPLPKTLAHVDTALSAAGMSSLTDDLELRINRAAEAATPKAKELFINAISQMSIDDARNILNGPDDAATKYLRQTMSLQLGKEMKPHIDAALAQAGAIQAYERVVGQYQQVPFAPNIKGNLSNYVIGKALDGIFYYVAQEEAAIRANPAARTTDLLRKVFASNS